MNSKRTWLLPLLATICLAILTTLNAVYGLERWATSVGLVMGMLGWACLAAMIKRINS
jgi:hypothetical protein